MTPRRAALVGIVFVVIAVIYYVFPTVMAAINPDAGHTVDFAGVTMLIALGAAMSLMAYVLVAGLQKN
jgi:amino acid permease